MIYIFRVYFHCKDGTRYQKMYKNNNLLEDRDSFIEMAKENLDDDSAIFYKITIEVEV